jgi:hypothetical protein
MKWLLLLAIYSNGHMTQLHSDRFATKEVCEASGKEAQAAFAAKDQEIKFVCLQVRKDNKGKIK